MITYYKKLFVTNVDTLCEAIHCSLTEVLVNVYDISVYYHVPSLQIRIKIKYEDRCVININLEREEYNNLLDIDNASEWDYGNFIAALKNDIKNMILTNYIK